MTSRRPRLLGLAALPLLCPIAYCYVPNPPSGRSNAADQLGRQQQKDEIVLPSVSVEESNFWRHVPKRQRPREDEVIPCESNLDADGPLPFGAYRTYGNPAYDPSRTCLLTVGLDFTADHRRRRIKKGPNKRRKQSAVESMVEGFNVNAAVRNVQQLIDAGFTSFQVADDPTSTSSVALQEWADESVFCTLRKQTPLTVLRNCNFSTKIAMPAKDSTPFRSGGGIREAVGASLRRTGADCIDTVQVPYCKDSPYHLDVLNVLFEMQEEGFIRSVSGLGFPPSILSEAEACNFHLDTNQIRSNLLDPQTYLDYSRICSDMNIKMLCGSPLAGGLLTEKYLQCERRPNPMLSSESEIRNTEQVLPVWARRKGNGSDGSKDKWEHFHDKVLKTIGDIAYKYQVSAASVALRWSLHLDNLGSVVVGSRVGMDDEDERPFTRPRALRKVFTFELDDGDMQRLWDATGCSRHEGAVDEFGEDGFVADLSNRKLWL